MRALNLRASAKFLSIRILFTFSQGRTLRSLYPYIYRILYAMKIRG